MGGAKPGDVGGIEEGGDVVRRQRARRVDRGGHHPPVRGRRAVVRVRAPTQRVRHAIEVEFATPTLKTEDSSGIAVKFHVERVYGGRALPFPLGLHQWAIETTDRHYMSKRSPCIKAAV